MHLISLDSIEGFKVIPHETGLTNQQVAKTVFGENSFTPPPVLREFIQDYPVAIPSVKAYIINEYLRAVGLWWNEVIKAPKLESFRLDNSNIKRGDKSHGWAHFGARRWNENDWDGNK